MWLLQTWKSNLHIGWKLELCHLNMLIFINSHIKVEQVPTNQALQELLQFTCIPNLILIQFVNIHVKVVVRSVIQMKYFTINKGPLHTKLYHLYTYLPHFVAIQCKHLHAWVAEMIFLENVRNTQAFNSSVFLHHGSISIRHIYFFMSFLLFLYEPKHILKLNNLGQ